MSDLPNLTVTYNSDGSATYVSREGDVVGLLCCRHYGHEWDTTELVLESNPGLAAYGVFLPAGVFIVLPVVTEATSSRSDTINLYD